MLKVVAYINSKTFFWHLIRFKQSWLMGLAGRYSRISHVELVDSQWISFSSSEEDGGVRFKKIDFKPENWEFIEIDTTPEEEEKIRKWCESKTQNNYNWWGIFFAMWLGFYTTGEDDYFCSQIVTRALQEIGECCTLSAQMTSPGQLCKYLEERWLMLESKVILEI